MVLESTPGNHFLLCTVKVLANGLVESKKDILLKARVSVNTELVQYELIF